MRLKLSLAVILTTLLSDGASAYVLLGQSWSNPVYTVNVRLQRAGATPQQWNDAFQVAVDRWNAATNEFTINMNRDVFFDPCNDPSMGDPIGNGAIFMDTQCGEDFGSSTLASTLLWFNGNDEFVQAGIVFNGTRTWGVYDSNATPFQIDLTRVAVHELGHAMGLAHEDTVPAIMATAVGNIIQPQADDINGIAAIYGAPHTDLNISLFLMDEISLQAQGNTLEVSIFNNGPNLAESVAIDLQYDSFLAFRSANSLNSGFEPEPACSTVPGGLQCTYDNLGENTGRTFEASFDFTGIGHYSVTGTVSSNLPDLISANNSQTVNAQVVSFEPSQFNATPSSTATFSSGEANAGSSFSLELTNESSLSVVLSAFRLHSDWPSQPGSTLLVERTDTPDLSGGILDPLESVNNEYTLSAQRSAPIVAEYEYVDPDDNQTYSIYVAFNEDGSTSQDSDGDETPDSLDAFPFDPNEITDTDGDGIGNNADTDDDNDGLSDINEVIAGTNPLDRDTDDDSLLDGYEVANGFDPLVADCPDEICDPPSNLLLRLIPLLN